MNWIGLLTVSFLNTRLWNKLGQMNNCYIFAYIEQHNPAGESL
jgi:hypothetical protein